MKGVLSGAGFYSANDLGLLGEIASLLEGTKRMFSVHIIGRLAYLLVHLWPIGVSVMGLSPQSNFLCASRSDGLASTKYTASILSAIGLKFRIVCSKN